MMWYNRISNAGEEDDDYDKVGDDEIADTDDTDDDDDAVQSDVEPDSDSDANTEPTVKRRRMVLNFTILD